MPTSNGTAATAKTADNQKNASAGNEGGGEQKPKAQRQQRNNKVDIVINTVEDAYGYVEKLAQQTTNDDSGAGFNTNGPYHLRGIVGLPSEIIGRIMIVCAVALGQKSAVIAKTPEDSAEAERARVLSEIVSELTTEAHEKAQTKARFDRILGAARELYPDFAGTDEELVDKIVSERNDGRFKSFAEFDEDARKAARKSRSKKPATAGAR